MQKKIKCKCKNKVNIQKNFLNIHGNEIRNVYQLMQPHRERLENEIKNIR